VQNSESLKFQCQVVEKSQILRELSISIEQSSIQGYVESSLNRLQKTTALKGFRKGKVPMSMIRQYFMGDVKADVVKQVVSDSFWQAVREKNISPVGSPEISDLKNVDLEEGTQLSFTAKVEIFPQIKLKDLSKVKAKTFTATMQEDEVTKTLENLQNSHAEILSAEDDASYNRAAKDGDTVELSFEGTVDGAPNDRLKGSHQIVKVGGKRFMQEIEDGIVGMKKGDTKKVTVKFPENFPDDVVAGKNVPFELQLHEIKKVTLPALDDEFAKRFKLETLDELKTKIRQNLEDEKTREAATKTKDSIIRAVVQSHEFEVPKTLIETETKAITDEFAQNLSRQGFTDKMIQSELSRRLAELESAAQDRVKAFLLLDRISEEHKIEATEEDFLKEYTEMSKNVGASIDQVKEFYARSEDALRRLSHRLKEDRVVDFLKGKVKIEEETLV